MKKNKVTVLKINDKLVLTWKNKQGKIHRSNGKPAIVWSDGREEHWENGVRIIAILKNVKVDKLKEYSRSYGSPEIIEYAFAKEYEKEYLFFNYCGEHSRTMRKGTRVLIDVSGKKITYKTFKKHINKAKKEREIEIKKRKIEDIKRNEELAELVKKREERRNFLSNTLNSKILEVLPKIKELIPAKNIFENRKENNELINRAVGFIGYEYARHLKWNYVVDKIVTFL